MHGGVPGRCLFYEDDLPDELQRFRDINASYFQRHPLEMDVAPATSDHAGVEPGSLRVAIIGAGPAACYAATELMRIGGVEVDMFERLPTRGSISCMAPAPQLSSGSTHRLGRRSYMTPS